MTAAMFYFIFSLWWVWCRFAPPILPAGSALDLNSLSNFLGNDYNGQFFAYSDLTPFALQARQPAPTAVPSYLVDGLFPLACYTLVLHGNRAGEKGGKQGYLPRASKYNWGLAVQNFIVLWQNSSPKYSGLTTALTGPAWK